MSSLRRCGTPDRSKHASGLRRARSEILGRSRSSEEKDPSLERNIKKGAFCKFASPHGSLLCTWQWSNATRAGQRGSDQNRASGEQLIKDLGLICSISKNRD